MIFIFGENMPFLNAVKDKSKTIALVYAVIFIPMWVMFFFNNVVFQGGLNSIGGIHPRDTSMLGLVEIFTSWMFHGGSWGSDNLLAHITGNSIALGGLLLIISLLESKPLQLIAALIFGSGLATWLIGSSASVHVGASGLVFAMFGYVISSVLFGRRWLYLIPIGLMGGEYFYSIKMGLVPMPGVSFAAHFGGFIAGLIIGYLFNRAHKKEEAFQRKITFKERWNSKVWDVKYYFKNKFRKV